MDKYYEYFEYLESLSQELKEQTLIDFALHLKGFLNDDCQRILFEFMFRNGVAEDPNCEHDILKDLGVPAWKWDAFLSSKKGS